MSLTLNRSFALQCFRVEIRKGIKFNFYPALPHIVSALILLFTTWTDTDNEIALAKKSTFWQDHSSNITSTNCRTSKIDDLISWASESEIWSLHAHVDPLILSGFMKSMYWFQFAFHRSVAKPQKHCWAIPYLLWSNFTLHCMATACLAIKWFVSPTPARAVLRGMGMRLYMCCSLRQKTNLISRHASL